MLPPDSPRQIIAATATGTAGVLVFALLPVLIGQLAVTHGLHDNEAGLVSSAYFGVYALIAATAPVWIRRWSWPIIARAGYVTMLSGLVLLLLASDRTMVYVAMTVTGAGASVLLPISLTLVSDMRRVERVYAITISLQQLVPALILIGSGIGLLGAYSLENTLYASFIVTIACLLLSSGLPDGRKVEKQGVGGGSILAFAGLIGLVLSFAGFAGLWAFFEIIGMQASLLPAFITQWLAIGLLMTAAGPLISVWMAERFGRIIPIVITCMIASVSLLLLSGAIEELDYALLAVVFPLSYYIGLSYALSIIAQADASKLGSSLMSFALAIGAFAGPAIFGYARSVYESSIWVIVLLLVIGTSVLVAVQMRARWRA